MLFVSFLFLTVIGNSIFTFKMESIEEEKLEWVIHTHEVLLTAEKLLSSLKDSETGQRGFLLTLNQSYLEPYHSGILLSREYFKKLQHLTSDNPEQQDRLNKIQSLIGLKLDELATTIALSNSDISESLALVKQNKGKLLMDNIREQLVEFNNVERLRLEQRKGLFREHRSQLITFLLAEILFFIMLGLLTVPFLNRNFFTPLQLLVSNTHKMEAGEKIDVSDIVSKDEMGYLLSRFYQMNQAIHSRAERLNYKANHDALTGLKNRSMLFKDINNTVRLKEGSTFKCAVCFIDLNNFKQMNDCYGHDAGDDVLIETAKRITRSLRLDDDTYRIGGDEFIVLIQSVKSHLEVNTIIQNVLRSFDTPLTIQEQAIELTVSIGIAMSPDNSVNSEELLNYADIAMYSAKNDQNTHYKFFNRKMLKRASDS